MSAISHKIELYKSRGDYDSSGGYLIPAIIETPKNKWQVFKSRYFPHWLQRIFPIKVNREDFKGIFLEIMKND